MTDNGEFITYTGQGGLSARSSTAHCIADQVLTRGNEALKNSYKGHWPIRVIRGDRDKKSPTGEVYTYIGLYQIMHMRYEPGKDGNLVYMFDLKRQGGQQPLPVCASPEPNRRYIANKPGSSTSMTVKRKWEDLPHAGGDKVASSPYSSSRGQWGIPLDFSNTKQTLYVRGSSWLTGWSFMATFPYEVTWPVKLQPGELGWHMMTHPYYDPGNWSLGKKSVVSKKKLSFKMANTHTWLGSCELWNYSAQGKPSWIRSKRLPSGSFLMMPVVFILEDSFWRHDAPVTWCQCTDCMTWMHRFDEAQVILFFLTGEK